jgi:tRNA threonylcarbamoyl adenosine modification protein YeaZ
MRLYGFGNINIGDGVLNNRESPGNVQGSPSAANWLLGVDTSTDQTGIAVTDGTDLLDVSLPGGRQQTRDLLPAIDWLLTQHGLTLGQLGAAAVAIGPGSFTGLRVGLSVAKGLALAQGAAVIGIPTLEIVAWPYRASATPVLAVLPAGRSRFVWAVAEPGVAIGSPVNSSLDELIEAAHARPDLLVAGEPMRRWWQPGCGSNRACWDPAVPPRWSTSAGGDGRPVKSTMRPRSNRSTCMENRRRCHRGASDERSHSPLHRSQPCR